MKRKEKKQEGHRDAKKREDKRRPNSRADAAGSAPRAKRRRFLEAPGENYPPLLLDGRACYYFTSLARMSKTKHHLMKPNE